MKTLREKLFACGEDTVTVTVYESGKTVVEDQCGYLRYKTVAEAVRILKRSDPAIAQWLETEFPPTRETA